MFIGSNNFSDSTLTNIDLSKEKMKRFTLTLIVIIYLASDVNGQNKTYLGFEVAVANDIYKIKDNGDYLKTIPLLNGQWGFNLRQEINKNLFIETGLMVKFYQEGFGLKTIPYNSSGSDENSWLIPVRFGLNVNLYKRKIHFVPVIGYSFGIDTPYGYGLGYGTSKSSTTVINYNYTENPNSSRYFSLLQTGIGLEFKFLKALIFSISANYYSGFNKITQLDIRYTVNNSTTMTGAAISKGEFWCIGTGLKYPISNFWTKEKQQ